MPNIKTLHLQCQCGQDLVTYRKGGSGRLLKIRFSRITQDLCGAFLNTPPLAKHALVHCPACGCRLGFVEVIGGEWAVKVNRGVLRY